MVNKHISTRLYKELHDPKRIERLLTSIPELMAKEGLDYNPEKPQKHCKGYVTLGLKTARRPLTANTVPFDPAGKQFEYLDIPRVSSRYRYKIINLGLLAHFL